MPSDSLAPSNTILFHLGYRLRQDTPLLIELLADIRYVILCGSVSRAESIARLFNTTNSPNICLTDRYVVLQPLPTVLVAAHGIGNGSIDILLHELYIALSAAHAVNWSFIRVGSCGGLGVPMGTVVVTRRTLNSQLEPFLRLPVLGKPTKFPARLHPQLSNALFKMGTSQFGEMCVHADTLCAETFYLAQARLDGAFADYSDEQSMQYLRNCQEQGVTNIEMESLPLAAFATKMSVPAAIVCAVLVDRLEHETPFVAEAKLAEYQSRAVNLVVNFVKQNLAKVTAQK